MEKKYIFSSLFIFIVILIIYKNKNKFTTKTYNDNDDLKSILKDLNKLMKYENKNKKVITKQLKEITNLNKLQIKHMKDVTNTNLFNKNIEKHRLFIDTHNIKGTLDRSNYTYHLNGSSEYGITNETGGYSEFKNVIGFRLVKAIIHNTNHVILDTRNTIIIELNDTAVTGDRGKFIKIILPTGFYTTDTMQNAFSNADYSWSGESGGAADTYTISVTFDSQKKHFTFTMANNYEFKFKWSDTNTNSAQTVLGFIKKDTSDFSNVINGDIPPDMSINYIDLIIDEIPSIACKYNAKGHKLIDRIGITSGLGELLEYTQKWDKDNENYFYPIKLNQLSIKLLESSHNHYYKSDRDHSFEFEITIIKNTGDFNLN